IERGRVVDGEEHIEQFAERNNLGIELDADHFGVAGGSSANGLVIGIGVRAAGVARFDGLHAAEQFEDGLQAPKAASAEYRRFGIHRRSTSRAIRSAISASRLLTV